MSWMFSRTVFGWFFAVMVGAFVGLGLFTFWYARGASYLTDDPRACINCHVMAPPRAKRRRLAKPLVNKPRPSASTSAW